MATLYHGTRAAYARQILRDGLIPGYNPGADRAAQKLSGNPSHFESWKRSHPERLRSVFLTPDRRVAEQFADLVALAGNDRPAIVRVNLPDHYRNRLVPDEAAADWDTDFPCYRYPGAIPPEWISQERNENQLSLGLV